MTTEIIIALVLATLFLGAIAWLAVYSRIQHRGAAASERQPGVAEPAEQSAADGPTAGAAPPRKSRALPPGRVISGD